MMGWTAVVIFTFACAGLTLFVAVYLASEGRIADAICRELSRAGPGGLSGVRLSALVRKSGNVPWWCKLGLYGRVSVLLVKLEKAGLVEVDRWYQYRLREVGRSVQW